MNGLFPFPHFGKEPENPERKHSAALLKECSWSDACGVGMESGNEQPIRQRFVLLRYFSLKAGLGQGTDVLLVAAGDELRIYTEKQWESDLDAGEREYLRELMKDWRGAGADRVGAILDELAELSVGPLRAVESGVADAEKLSLLVERFQ
jgi:hypothetical protein